MINWLTSLIPTSYGKEPKDRYGPQMTLTLSSHPFFDKYLAALRENHLLARERIDMKPFLKPYMFDLPKVSQNYPTVIVRGPIPGGNVFVIHIGIDKIYENGGMEELKEALCDESYYVNSIVLKDKNRKELNPALWKPIEFGPHCRTAGLFPEVLFWNTPIIFYGFGEKVVGFRLYYQMAEILLSNPMGPLINSFEFLDYMSQPVIFWIKPKIIPRVSRVVYVYEMSEDEYAKREPDNGTYDTFFLKSGPYSYNRNYDLLEYKIMSDLVGDDMFEQLRDSYLKSIGRELLDGEKGTRTNYLKPKQ